MKNQKFKFVAFLAAVLISITLLPAQRVWAQGVTDKIAQKMTDSLAYLNLTDQQKTQAVGFNKTAAASFVQLKQKMKQPLVYDGRNLFDPAKMKALGIEYYGIGRRAGVPEASRGLCR